MPYKDHVRDVEYLYDLPCRMTCIIFNQRFDFSHHHDCRPTRITELSELFTNNHSTISINDTYLLFSFAVLSLREIKKNIKWRKCVKFSFSFAFSVKAFEVHNRAFKRHMLKSTTNFCSNPIYKIIVTTFSTSK